MKLIRRADLTAQPWKNGGGRTWEIAAHPPGAGFDTMAWRMSMAEVATAGPFSAFAGIDRTLTVISGAMELDFAQGGAVSLDAASPPLAFPGEAAVTARLGSAQVIDFNVMTRRGTFAHNVTTLAAAELAPERTVALFARSNSVRVEGRPLAAGELLLADPGQSLAGLSGDGPLWAVALWALR